MGETEVALAARALAAKSGTAAVAERDEVGDTDVIDMSEALVRGRDSSTSAPRFPYLAVLGGAVGVGLLVLLVISVLTVSDNSKRPFVDREQAPSSSAAPRRADTAAPTSATVPATPAPQLAEPAPVVPTAQEQPPAQVMAPQAPLTAETMRPESPPPLLSEMFPRRNRWFQRLFPEG
jgi:hypothetical protein